ncbi:ATP-binding protein [Pseudooceanicola sp.]|uniref:hybrid sensor histidine kinase/response regulator n=1 Tax=Pseudooceanicola sp. TaxID=1914328 RepID=UPI0035C6A8C2
MTPPRENQAGETGQTKGFLPAADPADVPSGRIPLYRIGLGLLLLATIVLVGSLLIDVRSKLAELASSPQDNVQWTLSQFEVESLAFALEVERAQTDTAADLTDLRRRYDILYSRTRTLSQSDIYRQAFADSQLTQGFETIAEEVYGLAPLIDSENPALIAALPDIAARLAAMRPAIRAIMTEGNRALVHHSDASRREVSDVLMRLTVATAFLLIVLTTMVVQFRRLATTSDRNLRENLATSARLEAIFNTSRDGIVVVEQDGRIAGLNRAALDLFERTAEDMHGADIGKVLTRQVDTGAEALTGRALFDMAASDRHTGIRLKALRPGGASFPVEISVDTSPLERRPICVCIIRDISHQTAIEAELKTSRDRARAGERAKARFLGIVSHEMRTPLNGILGTLDLIEEETAPARYGPDDLRDTYLPVLRNSAEAMLALVNDVLDITQIEGGIRLNPRPFDLDRMLGDLMLAEKARAQSFGNTLEILGTDPVGVVLGDADRLRQVLANLLGNAVKFTRNGRVTLEAVRLDPATVEIQVSDTGFGMTEVEQARAFDDFFRTERSVNEQVQGTGLGLGIARSLTHAMRGEIGLESVPGEGTLFWLRLPLPSATLPSPPPDQRPEAIMTRSARVLLVEDNATNRFIARRLLENDGHSVVEAENGEAALHAAGAERFDLILMDISMPVLDGITAAQRIRDSEGPNRNTRITALTAHVTGGLDERRTRSVMDAVLQKPLDRRALRRDVQIALDGLVPAEAGQREPPLTGLDPATAARLTDRFLRETDAELATLADQLSQGALPPLPDLAARLHDLAGACASFGATALHDLFVSGETAARAGDEDAVSQSIRAAIDTWPEARRQLADSRPVTPE